MKTSKQTVEGGGDRPGGAVVQVPHERPADSHQSGHRAGDEQQAYRGVDHVLSDLHGSVRDACHALLAVRAFSHDESERNPGDATGSVGSWLGVAVDAECEAA